MEQSTIQERSQDPLLNIFEDGVEEFLFYERQKGQNYKTKHQRTKEKHEKLEKYHNDPDHKRERNVERRKAEKEKLVKFVSTMSLEQRKQYKKQRREKIKEQRAKVKEAMNTGQVMMIDCVFQDQMNTKENKSLCKQMELIMKAIRHIDDPPSIHLCSYGGQAQAQLEKMGVQHWFISLHQENVLETAQQMEKKIVYLSPDAQLPLQKVEKDTAYVLGGLIDRTIIKNASLIRSRKLGVEARRLPIKQYMKNRQVLNLDHVIMMVLKFRETNDWKAAFDYAAPKRWKKDQDQKDENSENEQQKIQKEQSNNWQPEKVQTN